MTNQDAEKVAAIVAQADGGCHVCAASLAEDLLFTFPEHDWALLVAKAVYDWEPESIEPYAEKIREGYRARSPK